jgi:hypothetical protein
MKEYEDRPVPARWEPPAEELCVHVPSVGAFITAGDHE